MKKNTSKTAIEENIYDFENGFLMEERVENGSVVCQSFKTKYPNETHPFTYESDKIKFYYLPEIPLDDVENIHFLSDEKLESDTFKPKIVDPESFDDWDNVFCPWWTGMDGHVWKILDKYPIPVWMSQDYIGGFCEAEHNLKKVREKLERIEWVRNIRVDPIGWYNQDSSGREGLYFEYKPPIDLLKKYFDIKEQKKDFDLFGGAFGAPSDLNLFNPYGITTDDLVSSD